MSALSPGEIRFTRRPFAILGVAALRLLLGFLLTWPLAAIVASSGIGLRGEGDRALFEGGGYFLLEILRLHGAALSASLRGLAPLAALALIVSAGCNAALLIALNVRERLTLGAWLAQAAARLFSFGLLGAGTVLGQLGLVVIGAVVAGDVPDLLAKPVTTSALRVAVWFVTAVLAAALGSLSDLAKAALVRQQTGRQHALKQAWLCLKARPLRACFGWLPYSVAWLTAVLVANQLSQLIDVARPGAFRPVAVLLIHQLVIVLAVASRSAWYASALRLVATTTGAPS